MPKLKYSSNYPLSIFIRFVFYFTISMGAVLFAAVYFEYQTLVFEQSKSHGQETLRVSLASKMIIRDLDKVIANLRTLANSDSLFEYVNNETPEYRVRLERQFLQLAEYEQIYDQIRFIDASGKERVRANYKNGVPFAVPDSQLQNKSHRYYYQQAIKLKAGQIYFSPLDLNVENDRIEVPYKPMIRVATPVFNGDGFLRGILIVNYLAEKLLDEFKEIMVNSWGEPMILNSSGYWLHSPHKEDEWGFMFGNDNTFAKNFPHAWKYISTHTAGLIKTQQGIFIFETITPYAMTGQRIVSGNENPSNRVQWKIVSRAHPISFANALYGSLKDHAISITLFLIFVGTLSASSAWLRINYQFKAAALRESEGRTKQLLESVEEGIFGIDLNGVCTFANPACANLLGYEDAAQLIGKNMHALIHHTRADNTPCLEETCHIYRTFREEKGFHVDDEIFWRANGTHFTVEYRSYPVRINGTTTGSVVTFIDVTERKQTERNLRQATIVFENTNQSIVVTDANRNIIAVNKAFSEITGYTQEEVLGKNPRILQSGQHDRKFYKELWNSLREKGQWQGEILNRRKNGEIYPAWENISAARDKQGNIVNYVSILSDISVIKAAEQRLHYLAHHDALTELPNRLLFEANLDQALARSKRLKEKVGLLYLDLDRFKTINDTLGHAYGDQLLKIVASRLKNSLRAADTVARLGGDEFTIILYQIGHADDAARIAQNIIAALTQPVSLYGKQVVTSTSIGISVYPDDAEDSESLIKAADIAMYYAKDQGRNNYKFYRKELKIQTH